MNQDQLVEAIINEVKRVLALRGVSISAAPTSPVPEKKQPTPTAEKRAPQVPSEARSTDQSIGSRDLTGKQIITISGEVNHGNQKGSEYTACG